MKNQQIQYIFFMLGVVFAHASIAAKVEYSFGVGLMDFNYVEYDENKVFLNGESGFIPSVLHKLRLQTKIGCDGLILSAFYEILNIGKGNNVRLTSDGVDTSTVIHGPRSETRNVGIEITWLG